MSRIRLISAAALLTVLSSPLAAAATETWTVTCQGVPKWTQTTPPNQTNGAFEFTLLDGTQVRTTAGMNCVAQRNPPRTN